jgi:hypothetical protein
MGLGRASDIALIITLGAWGCRHTEPVSAQAELAPDGASKEASLVRSGPATRLDPPQESAVDANEVWSVAVSWLSAIGAQDHAALTTLSGPSLSVTGFTLPNGPEWDGCGEPNAFISQRAMRVGDGAPLARVLECLLKDNLLTGVVPRIPPTKWSERVSDPDRHGVVGYLRPLDLSAVHPARHSLHPRLERHRASLSAVNPGAATLIFFLTNRRGSVAYGAMVVEPLERRLLVTSVFIDEESQC